MSNKPDETGSWRRLDGEELTAMRPHMLYCQDLSRNEVAEVKKAYAAAVASEAKRIFTGMQCPLGPAAIETIAPLVAMSAAAIANTLADTMRARKLGVVEVVLD